MRKKEQTMPVGMALIVLLIVMTVLLAAYRGAGAETLPVLSGDLALTGAAADIRVAECLRVDVTRCEADGTWAELTLPEMPSGIADVMLYDGWHVIHARWSQTGRNTLRVGFQPGDITRLDGTVGIYLVILAECAQGRL